MRPKRIEPGPGQESVWDYPRPPAIEPNRKSLRVEFAGTIIAQTNRGFRVLETSHPPVYYLPPEDCNLSVLRRGAATSFCEFKGVANYYDIVVGDRISRDAGWFYAHPSARFAALVDHVAFYATRVDTCSVDDELVQPQAGDFYGGWITNGIVGPFKGSSGTWGW